MKKPNQKAPDLEQILKRFDRSVNFKQRIGLYDTVRNNENFFIGKQWEGVESNGLPKPVFNFLKRVLLYQIASITSDNIAMQATPISTTAEYRMADVERVADIVSRQFEMIFERNRIPWLMRSFLRNAGVMGDACLYTYFDDEIETGQTARGDIVTQVVENTRVHFGNPCSRDVQSQPYIMLHRRLPVEEVRCAAKAEGLKELEQIRADSEDYYAEMDSLSDDLCTDITYLWKSRETKTVWMIKCTKQVIYKQATDTGLTLYPVTWLSWDDITDSYHGQAEITGLIPNQVFINKLFAMSMISLMTTAFPKIIYDKTRLTNWDTRVGAAMGVMGGDMNSVAKIIDPASISPQIAQFIELAQDMTQNNMGASDVALGDTRPDNTSAIVALQRASNVPLEMVKQNLFQCVEQLGRIYIDQMRNYYGKRFVQTPIVGKRERAPLGMELSGVSISEEFDFSTLKDLPLAMKLDVGASSYWSEIATVQTLDNLLMQGKIELVDYLERIPSGYLSKKQELIEKLRGAAIPSGEMAAGGAPDGAFQAAGTPDSVPLRTGSGYGALQRAVTQTAQM